MTQGCPPEDTGPPVKAPQLEKAKAGVPRQWTQQGPPPNPVPPTTMYSTTWTAITTTVFPPDWPEDEEGPLPAPPPQAPPKAAPKPAPQQPPFPNSSPIQCPISGPSSSAAVSNFSCQKARFAQMCQLPVSTGPCLFGGRIHLGDCVMNLEGHGWVHPARGAWKLWSG